MSTLSVCFPTIGEPENAIATARSIRETTKHVPNVEIVCVDDSAGTTSPVDFPPELNVVVHRNVHRCGSGASRHIAAQVAKGEVLLLCDSHMLFSNNWYEEAAKHIFLPWKKTVHCASMVALDPQHTTLENHNGHYYGARFEFCRNHKVLEAVWADDKPGDDYPLQCVMGAAYFVPRAWYLKLSPHKYIRSFGNEEESLSLKTWLAGGEVRMLRNVKIGHRFRGKRESIPYTIRKSHRLYNQLFLILTCLPERYHQSCIKAFQNTVDFRQAMGFIEGDWHIIEQERLRNSELFQRNFDWLRTEFKI